MLEQCYRGLLCLVWVRKRNSSNIKNFCTNVHRPLYKGKVKVTAEIIQKGKNIATIKGALYNSENKIAATLMHTAFLFNI